MGLSRADITKSAAAAGGAVEADVAEAHRGSVSRWNLGMGALTYSRLSATLLSLHSPSSPRLFAVILSPSSSHFP